MNRGYSIGLKLASLVLAAIAFSVVIALAGLQAINNSAATSDTFAEYFVLQRDAANLDMLHDAIRSDVILTVLASESAEIFKIEGGKKQFDDHVREMQRLTQTFTVPSLPEQLKKHVAPISGKVTQYAELGEDVINIVAVDPIEARVKLAEFEQAFRELERDLAQLGTDISITAEALRQSTLSAAKSGSWLILTVAALALLALAFISWLISRSISVPIRHAVKVAHAVAAGDLSLEINASGKSEIAELMRALGYMSDSLNKRMAQIMGELRNSGEAIALASRQLVQGNNNLANRTEEQASTVEETAASVEELSATVKQNAQHALEAKELAETASSVASKGGEVVSRVVSTMDQIHQSSKKISDIISVIDGISFQTNILALNAAVEAARAGEQGRGFAVVASEVRNLAQRSALAAKEIKTLIGDSVSKVEAGSKLVAEAGQTMTATVDSIRRVTALMFDIANASQEQSDGIEQIGQAITQIDDVTQQNAALVEQASAASESLERQAFQLAELFRTFKLTDEQPVRAEAVPAFPEPSIEHKVKAPLPPTPKTKELSKNSAEPANVSDGDDWTEF